MSDCVFCRIVAGAIPSQKVFEDEHILAVRDINPQAPVHVLLLPKKHVASLLDARESDGGLLGRIALVAAKIARQEGIAERGFRLLTNTGPEGGQAVAHLHFHLLGGRKMQWPPG
jgi:histidine triad (HIT) family protein